MPHAPVTLVVDPQMCTAPIAGQTDIEVAREKRRALAIIVTALSTRILS
jgi:hypothetical protein